jgi:hypothetical protein
VLVAFLVYAFAIMVAPASRVWIVLACLSRLPLNSTFRWSTTPTMVAESRFPTKLNEAVSLNSDAAPIKPLKGGQIVKLRQTVAALHTGILCFSEMGRTIIHASIESGKVIEDSLDQWKPMVLGLREFKGTVD